MRRLGVLLVSSLVVAGLAACGSDSSGTDSSGPASSGPASTAAPSTTGEASTPTSSAAPSTSAPASSVGPAPAGAVIKADAYKNFPASIGDKTKSTVAGANTATSAQYKDTNGDLYSVGFLLGSNYDTIVTAIKRQKTQAGTGACGTDSGPDNFFCYLKGDGGVYTVNGGHSVAEVSAFANQATAALGTS